MNIRLKAIADLIKPCDLVADIGTDHAQLPVFLISSKLAKRVIAVENKQLPLNNAITTITKNNLQAQIQLYYCNGIEALLLNSLQIKINYLVIAGLGGHKIADILNDADKLKIDYLILQPNIAEAKLRVFLKHANWRIYHEMITLDNDVYYEIIICHKSKGTLIKSRLDIVYGPVLFQKNSSYFIKKWQCHLSFLNLNSKAAKHPVPKGIYQKSINQIKEDLKI